MADVASRAAEELVTIAREAVAACRAEARCRQAVAGLDIAPAVREQGRVHLVGAGKAAAAMAKGAVAGLGPPQRGCPVRDGLVITKDDHHEGFAAEGIELRFAAHPEPDERSAAAGTALLARLSRVPADDHVIALVSGGASSLIASPVRGLSLAALRSATAAMLAGGIPIEAMNGVRKHLTIASGGRLAEAVVDARIDVLVVSDVLSDALDTIGSGPFAPDSTTYAQALEVVADLEGFPAEARTILEDGLRGLRPETPARGHPCFDRVHHHVVASHATLIAAAVERAEARGYRVKHLPPFGGDVGEAAVRLVEASASLTPGEIVITGGEPTVTLPDHPGRGGRNQQLALLVAGGIAGEQPRVFVALGSDGTDGPTDAAGAWVDHHSLARLSEDGDPDDAVARADAYPLLRRHRQLVVTGPTGTNVLDLHLLAAPRED